MKRFIDTMHALIPHGMLVLALFAVLFGGRILGPLLALVVCLGALILFEIRVRARVRKAIVEAEIRANEWRRYQ